VTVQEDRALLEIEDGVTEPEEFRRAYLRRVGTARLEIDPGGFIGLRDAYEHLTHGAGTAVDEVTAAREELAAQPDAAEVRWRLLSYFPYGASPDAFAILREGVDLQPDEFLDELLFHFPEKVPAGILQGARAGAAFGRLLLIADVHATQGRSGEALEVLRDALAAGDLRSPGALRLATRPVFSLHAHAQIEAASEALALVKQTAGRLALDPTTNDPQVATTFGIADELGRLGTSLPLDLRQVAASAAKRGDFENAPYEARFATRLLKPREVRKLSKQLAQDAPMLAKIFRLDLTEDQLRPAGIPRIKIPLGWGTVVVTLVLSLSWFAHQMRSTFSIGDIEEMGNSALMELVTKAIQKDCADPNSEACNRWDYEAREVRDRDAATVPDGGLTLPMIGHSPARIKPRSKTHKDRL
jgi:hypothetical protein